MKSFKTFRTIVCIVAASFLAPSGYACTTAVISAKASATGRPMLFKQRDSGVKFNYVDYFAATDSSFAFIAVVNTSDAAREEAWSGANSEGFAIMNSMSYGLSPLITDFRPWEGIVMKKALEICRTVDDFQRYLESLPQPNGLEANFGVIDAQGGAAYFETHDYGFTRFDAADSKEGYLVRSNYSMTGREGEGKGYDRYDIACAKMDLQKDSGFTAEWLIDELGRDPVIARKTTVGSTVIEGVGPGDPLNSSVMWCAPGYAPASFAIPSWVASGGLIAGPLKFSARGSALNELSYALLQEKFLPYISEDPDGSIRCHYENGDCLDIMSAARTAESAESAIGRRLDSLVRNGLAKESDYEAFSAESAKIFNGFAACNNDVAGKMPLTRHGSADERVLVAYVFRMESLPDPTYLTHINYAFGHVNDTFDGVRIDTPDDLHRLASLKKDYPYLKVLISIGGWGSGRFSEMAADAHNRESFAGDCKRVLDEFNLDGIDIDWEYPTRDAAGISASPEDTDNYTLLMRDIRAAIGPGKLLTQATVASAKYMDFRALDQYLDFTNIMSYDLGWAPYHNATLHRSGLTTPNGYSVEEAVLAHLAAGVPAHKLTLGMPFYGRSEEGFPHGVDITKAHLLPGYTPHWDSVAQVPYLTNDATGAMAFGYDNEKSLALKARYAVEMGLLGGMYWAYNGDNPAGDLRRTVYQVLNGLDPRLGF